MCGRSARIVTYGRMKSFFILTAVGAMCIGPSQALSAPSYGATTPALMESMTVFCYQAYADANALNEPLTGELKRLCS